MMRLIGYAGIVAGLTAVGLGTTAEAGRWGRGRCGCSSPHVVYTSQPAPAVAARPAADCLTPSWTELQVTLVPTQVTEKRTVCSTTYRDEERSRAVVGYKTVPIEEEKVRLTTVMRPRTETKTISYETQVAVQTEEQKTYAIKVPVWEDQEETYIVKVPVLTEVDENYTVKVPVLQDVSFTYTVNVPHPVTRSGTRTVSTVVPTVKTRSVDFCVPVTRMQTARVDQGHWEYQTSEESAGRGGRTSQAARRVWVPNVVTEETPTIHEERQSTQVEYLVYEQHYESVPYECTCIEYRPETRTGTMQAVVYQDETRTRKRTAVEYRDENRTRVKKVLTFKEEQRTENYPVVKYEPQTQTKEVSFTVQEPETQAERYTVTRHVQVPEHRIENYTVRVPVPDVKEVDVQVTRMVPRVISVTVNPCGGPSQPGEARPIESQQVRLVPARR